MILPFTILSSHSGAKRRQNDSGTSGTIIDGKIIRRTVQARFATTGPGGGKVRPREIGLEDSLDGNTLWVASNHALYPVNKSNNSVGSAFLTGGTISTLNFLHFSEMADPTQGLLHISVGTSETSIVTKLSLIEPLPRITLQWSDDVLNWDNGPVYRPTNGVFSRDLANAMWGPPFLIHGRHFQIDDFH